MMNPPIERCPSCRRPFESISDFPRIRVLAIERLPIPEAIDSMSAEAAEKRYRRRQPAGRASRFGDGINRTPEIQQAYEQPSMRAYFEKLSSLIGQVLPSQALCPPWPPDGR